MSESELLFVLQMKDSREAVHALSQQGSGIKAGIRCIYSHIPCLDLDRISGSRAREPSCGCLITEFVLPFASTRSLCRTSERMPRALPTWAALRDARIRKSVAGQSFLPPFRRPSLARSEQVPTDPTRDYLTVDNELLRKAYKYIRDNAQLDFRTRAAAMHKLNAMPTSVSLLSGRCSCSHRRLTGLSCRLFRAWP